MTIYLHISWCIYVHIQSTHSVNSVYFGNRSVCLSGLTLGRVCYLTCQSAMSIMHNIHEYIKGSLFWFFSEKRKIKPNCLTKTKYTKFQNNFFLLHDIICVSLAGLKTKSGDTISFSMVEKKEEILRPKKNPFISGQFKPDSILIQNGN